MKFISYFCNMDNKEATLQLGTQPVGKLLLQYALPAIVAMTAASLYNIVDSVFIGQRLGPLAISGLAITFPFMNLASAFGAAVGIGAATSISVKLGQKDYATAENILGNTITLNLMIGIAFSVVTLLFLDPILLFFGASHATLPFARDYMVIILAGNVFSHMYFGMNAILRAASKPRLAMFATIFTVLMNTLLDYIFIILFDWGIAGAAYATILAQIIALVWQMKVFSNPKELLHLKRGIYRLRRNLVKNIISIGISPFAMNVCATVVVIFIILQLVHYDRGMAHCHVWSLLLCTRIHERSHTHSIGHQGHSTRHVGLSYRGLPDGHHKLLPKYWQSEGEHLPLFVQTIIDFTSLFGHSTPVLSCGWRVVCHADERFYFNRYRCMDDETLYEEIPTTTVTINTWRTRTSS